MLKSFLKNKNLFLFLSVLTYILFVFWNINNIPTFIGDEKRYRISVEAMMDGTINTNNHPLFAKTVWLLVVDFFYILTGTDLPVFWRMGSIIFSLLSLFVFFKISKLFFSEGTSLIAIALLAFDPMFFVFGRTLHLDMIMLFFSLLALYYLLVFFRNSSTSYFLFSAVFFGLSLASKLSFLAVVLVIPLFVIFLKKEIKPSFFKLKLLLGFYFIVLLVFFAGNSILLFYGKSVIDVLGFSYALIKDNFGIFNEAQMFQTSPAFTWFFIPQILSMYRIDLIENVESIIAFQNPIMFGVGAFSFILVLIALLRGLVKEKREISIILVFLLGTYLPWFLNLRATYYYYIIPMLPLLIILFVKVVVLLNPSNIILRVVLVLNIFLFLLYFPLLVGIRVPKKLDLMLYGYSRYEYPVINRLFCQNCYPRK